MDTRTDGSVLAVLAAYQNNLVIDVKNDDVTSGSMSRGRKRPKNKTLGGKVLTSIIDGKAYSSCTKLFTVTAYVYRFARNLKLKVKKVKNLVFGKPDGHRSGRSREFVGERSTEGP